ncbi:unnamed protein product [Arctia plantaginis]|uniref:DUF4773 domain-containing protein n=1 Tax=Arctia plantaginis TaxID=874455 RepID=A0A8S1A1W3_ARCPL|nr:unnamed protein product [Arctia plantaginis]
MGHYLFFSLLLVITTYSIGYGHKPYEIIKFKIPRDIWQKALHPTPVLKSSVTVTIPIDVQDNSNEEDEDAVDDEAPELDVDTVDTEVTPGLDDPVPVVSGPTTPASITQSPVLQDEIITEEPPVPGQVTRLPCECRNRHCGCCTGALMERFRMKTCGNITFVPEDFVFDVKLNVNNRTVVRRRVSGLQSGKKPRPVSSSGPKPVNLFGNTDKPDNDVGGLIGNTVGSVFENGLFGIGGQSSSNDDGPFDGFGDAIGDFLDFE